MVLLDIVTMKFGSFGYCDYEGLVLLDIVTMNVTILAKEQRWKKSKRKIREAIDRNNKKEANIIIIIITIVELPSVGELRNNFNWIEERN